jgi:hypothetical protein
VQKGARLQLEDSWAPLAQHRTSTELLEERRDAGESARASVLHRFCLTDMALSCAPRVEQDATTGGRPANRPPDRPPAGWRAWQAERRRRVSCSALLGRWLHTEMLQHPHHGDLGRFSTVVERDAKAGVVDASLELGADARELAGSQNAVATVGGRDVQRR